MTTQSTDQIKDDDQCTGDEANDLSLAQGGPAAEAEREQEQGPRAPRLPAYVMHA